MFVSSSDSRKKCLECLSFIGRHKATFLKGVAEQKLSGCMMNDYSDINFQDEVLHSFFQMIGAPIVNETTLGDLYSLLPKLNVESKYKESIYGHALDKIMSAVDVPGGTKYLDQILCYLQIIPFSEIIDRVAWLEVEDSSNNSLQGDRKSKGLLYHVDMSYQFYHFEQPHADEGPDVLTASRLCEASTFSEILFLCEDAVKQHIGQCQEVVRQADEHIFIVLTFDIMKGDKKLITFQIDERLNPYDDISFDLNSSLMSSDIVCGNYILSELSGCNAIRQSRLIKGRLLETDLGM